jgi:hypothetical protein
MDAFIGRSKYDSFLGKEALHLRAWLPLNIRAFIASIEHHYQVPVFVKESGDPRLMGVFEGILEAYISERGWLGTHRFVRFRLPQMLSIDLLPATKSMAFLKSWPRLVGARLMEMQAPQTMQAVPGRKCTRRSLNP